MPEFGKYISGGLGHSVYEDAKDPQWLLKRPTNFRLLFEENFEGTAKDIALATQLFGEFIPPTTIEKDAECGYVIHQRRVHNARPLTVADISAQPNLQAELAELLRLNAEAQQQSNASLDLYGFAGLYRSAKHSVVRRMFWLLGQRPPRQKPELANILVGSLEEGKKKTDHVYAVDCSLLHLNAQSTLEYARANTLFRLHKTMLKQQFGLPL